MKLAMFDIDGTLTQSYLVDGACFVRALDDVFGFREICDDWSVYPHCTDSGILAVIFQERRGRPPTSDEIAAFQSQLVSLLATAALESPIRPVDGAREMLELLSESPDWAVALASGAWETSARLKMASANLCFSHLPAAFADNAMQREAIMQASLERALKLHGRETFDAVVYVGDGIWDARACRALGWPFIGIASDAAKAARLLGEGAKRVFPHFLQVEAFQATLQS